MKALLILFGLCFLTVTSNSQTFRNDSTGTAKTSHSEMFRLNIPDTYLPEEEFTDSFNTNIFMFKLKTGMDQKDNFQNGFMPHNLYLTSNQFSSPFNENKTQLFNSFYEQYQRSRPTKTQQILGMVNFSGAFILAGYHVWKYYIKKQ